MYLHSRDAERLSDAGAGCAGLPTWFLWARNRPFDCDRPRLNRSKKPQPFQGDAVVFQRWASFKSNSAFYKNAPAYKNTIAAQSGSAAVPQRAAAVASFKIWGKMSEAEGRAEL
ncbi:hypothetical protein FH063_003701 [Azospirillum argentinense]|uniref:Uncharacterized protein n=1 Tax=Azospirillum argentinense TaxID=2970906 RepID=A0A5B0KZP2_9PROT|nr:hypothetical protein FH063_003701 [Azospirillum argentinense]